MLIKYIAQNIAELVNKVSEHGFCVMDNFISQDLTLALADEITVLQNTEKMIAASTGRAHKVINKQLRGDSIYWLIEANASSAQQAYFSQMEVLRLYINQHLFLGLFALESHLALYPAGAGYKKHIDRFKNDNSQVMNQPARKISCILYLNQNWLTENGGHLRLYLNTNNTLLNESQLDIAPCGGRLVIFLSDTFYHEVLPATQDRISLTGWFLTR